MMLGKKCGSGMKMTGLPFPACLPVIFSIFELPDLYSG